MNFSNILKQGKRRFEIKNKQGQWGRCESCESREFLFPYDAGSKSDKWMLCHACLETFVKDEK